MYYIYLCFLSKIITIFQYNHRIQLGSSENANRTVAVRSVFRTLCGVGTATAD